MTLCERQGDPPAERLRVAALAQLDEVVGNHAPLFVRPGRGLDSALGAQDPDDVDVGVAAELLDDVLEVAVVAGPHQPQDAVAVHGRQASGPPLGAVGERVVHLRRADQRHDDRQQRDDGDQRSG